MSSRQTVCENCVSICQVPKSLSKDAVISIFTKSLRGRVTDLVTVAGTEQDRNLTRWIVLLESTEDVRYLLDSLREDRIQVAEHVFTVTFRRSDPCDIPDEWLQDSYAIRESQHFHNDTEVTHKPPVFPRRSVQRSDYIKRQHGNQQNVQHPQNLPHIPQNYQSVLPNMQIEVEKTNVGMNYEQQQASHNLQSNQYYLEQENNLQHGRIPPQMIPNIPPGNSPVRYPYMPYANAPLVGEMSGQNLPQYNIQMNPNAQFEQHPGFYPNMMHFEMPPNFNPPASGIEGGYNVSFAGKTTPQFTNPHSGYPTAGYHSSSKQPYQPGLTVDDDLEQQLANVDDENELDSCDEDDLHHEKEQYTQEVKERPARILVSNLPSSAHEEYLEMFFESPKNIGVQAKNIELDEETNSAVVEFDDPNDVDVVLGKRPVKMMGQVVDIEVYTPEPLCTIRVKGHPSIMHSETLELYFENKKKSNGGNVQHIEYDSEEDVFYVSFETEEIAQRVLEKPNHTVSKKNLHVQLCKTKSNKKKLQNKADKYKEVAEDTAKVREPVCSVKVKGVKALPSRETIEFYFENQKRSGGGDIEDIQTDEEDDDIVYIKYKSEQVARTVADRNHILEECELDVSLYVPPKPLPSYENKVLIKGLNPKTTQDCLFNFIEAKSGFTTMSMVRHTQKEDVVMLTMEESSGDFTFEKLEKIFANARLEGNTLKVARVPVTDCIIVYNLSDDMTAETVQYFFENKRRSGGGPVRKVVMNDDNTCFVYFTDFKTIDSVLENKHTLGKQVMLVQKYQECIARPEGELIQRKLNIPAPLILNNVDPEKIKFINNSHVHKEMISFELKKAHAHIIWPKESGYILLDCTLTKEDKNCFKIVKTWKTEALRIFEDLMKNIVVHKIDVLQDIWQNVLEKLITVSVRKPEDVAVFVDKNLEMITVSGKKTIVDDVARRVNEIKNDAMAELEKERQTITENVTGLKPLETKLLLLCRFPIEMKKEFDGLKVNINTKANKVIFEGSLSHVQRAKLKMFEMKSRFQFQKYKDISQMKQTLFLSDKTKDFIVEQLKSRHVKAAWEVKESGKLVVCFDGDLSEDVVKSLICDSVKESNIALRDESKPLMSSKRWSSELEDLNSRFQGKCIVEVSEDISKVIICATEDILDEVVDSVKKFLHLNTVLVHKVSHSSNAHRLIEKHHEDVLKKISKDLNDPSVLITPLENYEGFEVHGTEYGIRNASIQLNKLFDQIRFREHTIDKPGLSRHMNTPKGKDSLNTIASMLQCTITMKKGEEQANTDVGSECEYYGRRNRSRRSVRDDRAYTNIEDDKEIPYEIIYPTDMKHQDYKIGNISVVVKQGDITEENADCIVNSSNEALDLTRGAVSKIILEKGGRSLAGELDKLRKKMKQNHFVVSSAKGLPCKNIIHVVARDTCKEWKQIIITCLDEAERRSLKSIAFPALGTGIQMKALDMALTMVSAVTEFEMSKPTSLTNILLVIYRKEMVEEFHKSVRGTKDKGAGWSLGGLVQAVKGIMPWSSSHGEETYARLKTDNNKITFIINAMSEDIIDKAVEKLESVLGREVEKKVFDDSIIRKMDDNQVMEIKAIARQHHLNLTLEKKRGYMEISGIASNIMTASDKIYRIIRDAVTLEQQQNSADILSNIVQWYFIEIREAGQKLQPYVKNLNFKIENAYKNKDKQVKFSEEHVTYILNFQKMEEYPEDDPADVVSVIRRDLIKQSSFGAFDPPDTWADMTGNLRVVPVQPGTPEYQSILQTFTASTGGSFTVNKIERVQNKTLWQQYQAKKKQLENQNAQGTQNERLLWHGTSPDSIDNINAHGFNRSYCGKNAVAYGNGVYFAVNASYSCGGYSQPDSSGVKRVYYCRVLTGEYTTGTYGMRVPPQKVGATSSTDLYDSVVDSPAGPSMFIIFHDTQAYPEYLLSFQ